MNRTKRLICDTFWQLLEEKPYNKITVQNIVERCQLNRNTFYYHFQDIPALAEFSIQEWAENQIKTNCELGSPMNCVMPIAEEFTRRRNAFIHLYHSSRQDAFIRYLGEICFHTVEFYVSSAVGDAEVSEDCKNMLTRYYKCVASGIILDWLDSGMAYDLSDFCEKICVSFHGAGQRAFLQYSKAKETLIKSPLP